MHGKASPGFPSGNLLELLQGTALGSAISPQIPQLPAHLPNYLVASPSQTVGMEQTRSAVGAGMGFTGNLVPSALGTGSGAHLPLQNLGCWAVLNDPLWSDPWQGQRGR